MIKLEDIRIIDGETDGSIVASKKVKEIRLDFDNDRQHAVLIMEPFTVERVADKLRQIAYNILNDPNLKG